MEKARQTLFFMLVCLYRRRTQVVRERSAKPLCVRSNRTGALVLNKMEYSVSKKYLFLLIILGCIFLSCSKSGQNQDAGSETESEAESIENLPLPQGVLVLDGSLNELRDDGKMYWKGSVYAGDTVNWTGEQIDAVLSFNNQTRTFWRVEANGDFWVQQYFIHGPGVPGVIIKDEAVLYTKPDPGAVARGGIITLPKFTFVAILKDDDLKDDFIPIAAQLGGAKPDERWIKITDVSWNKNDIDGVKITRTAAATKNSAAHIALLENAMEIMGKGQSLFDVPGSVNYNLALFELTITNNLEILENGELYYALQDSVNIRELPTVNSTVTGQLQRFESMVITAKSKLTEKIDFEDDTIEGVWCRTDEGNWIFSFFITNQGHPGN